MLRDPQVFLTFAFLFSIFFVFVKDHEKRKHYLIFTSLVLIYAISAYALLFVTINTLLLVAVLKISQNKTFKYSTLIYGLIIVSPLFIFRSLQADGYFSKGSYFWVTLGLTFYSIKSFAIFIASKRHKKILPLTDIYLTNIFFPTFSSGPVLYPETFKEMNPSVQNYIQGFLRITVGIFKANFVAGLLISGYLTNHYGGFFKPEVEYSVAASFGFIFLKFLYTYINFSGYSDIAIGTGQLFGIKVPENFNFPIIATSIKEFWRRWHISLGDWVTSYLFFPLLGGFKKAKTYAGPLATFFAFVLLGLWHKFAWTYFVWGAGHGILLAINQIISLKKIKNQGLRKVFDLRIVSYASWGSTLFAVAFLQTFANTKSVSQGMILIQRLIGVL